MKKLILLIFLGSFSFRAIAPNQRSLVLSVSPPIEAFRELIYAVGMVEAMGDTSKYNELEEAAGYFQIRPIRLADYNSRTGSHFTMKDMFNYKISEKVFLYFAFRIGPYDFEKIAKTWNGSGEQTIEYWNKIKQFLH